MTNLLILLGFRIVWQLKPNLLTCAVFWGVLGFWYTVEPFNVTRGLQLAGSILNAAVTMANGGFMPVAGAFSSSSLWVSHHDLKRPHLTVLSDCLGLGDIRFSVGDVLIGVGLVLALVIVLVSLIG